MICVLCLFFLFSIEINAINEKDEIKKKNSNKFYFDVGEELLYDVDFYFIHLGTIKLEVFGYYENKDVKVFKTRVLIKSNPSLPFVNIEQRYESHISENGYPIYFLATEPEKDYIKFTEYKFNYEKKKIYILKGKYNPYQIWTDSTAELKEKYQDGLSLFYFARNFSGLDSSIRVSVFIVEKYGDALINFTSKKISVKNKELKLNFDAYYLNGIANFVGVYGLTGKFEAYFSADKESVPILAKMNVIIGSVNIKLKEWRKNKWKTHD